MLVNKSMFPLQTGFSALSSMQSRMADLQTQLGSGLRSSTLAGMGSDLPLSLSIRDRLAKIEGFQASAQTLDLRFKVMGDALTRLTTIESDTRTSAQPSVHGSGAINLATVPQVSRSRFDEMVTLLNSEVAGRHLFGGATTDRTPLADPTTLIEGNGGRDGLRAVTAERQLADAGAKSRGRLETETTGAVVTLWEDGAHPFGFKLSTMTPGLGRTEVQAAGSPAQFSFDFTTPPAAGDRVTLGLTLPDGTERQITLTASASAAPGSFVVDADPAITAQNFAAALDGSLAFETETSLHAASAFVASKAFFNGPGEPQLRVDGNPATATALRVAQSSDTVSWYGGDSPAVSAQNLGRLTLEQSGADVSLSRTEPVSARHGFAIGAVTTTSAAVTVAPGTIGFSAVPNAGERISVTLRDPDGVERVVTLSAVEGRTGPGQFSRGESATEAAANFAKALEGGISEAARAAEGSPRQSVSARIDDATRLDYGVAANERGMVDLLRTLGAMSVETYPTSAPGRPDEALDARSRARFDAMASRQQSATAKDRNAGPGSIEAIVVDISLARSTAAATGTRQTAYAAQLKNMQSEVESISKEEVAVEILALQTRLQASYQVTSMVSQLSLVNFL